MITLVDTNVLLDVFLPDPQWGEKSKQALDQAYADESLVINEIIYAELAPQFPEKRKKRSSARRFPGRRARREDIRKAPDPRQRILQKVLPRAQHLLLAPTAQSMGESA